MTHTLKCWQPYFDAVAEGIKTFEIRENDRQFAVGDMLLLREYEPASETYSGREIKARVTYIISAGTYKIPNYVVMSIQLVKP